MNGCIVGALALLLDRAVGDPARLPHPVIWMGKWIRLVENKLHHPTKQTAVKQRLFGCGLTLSTVGLAYTIPWALLHALHRWPVVAATVSIILTATTIAWKGLVNAGCEVYIACRDDELGAARQAVGKIVGRDTAELSESEVVRATVETLAENIVDAIVAPLICACLGGAPLALAYRAANTLDSMVGYKNTRYLHFGWASARLDDILNYIPARLTAVLLWLTALRLHLNAHQAWLMMRRDARKHPSPNSGIPESMVAGMLGVQLGGANCYGGIPSQRAAMGTAQVPLALGHITGTIRVVHMTSWLLCLGTGTGGVLIWALNAGLR